MKMKQENNGNSAFKKMIFLVAALILIFIVQTCFYQVRVTQAAVLTTFEKPVKTVAAPGLHMKAPWPIQKAYVFDKRNQLFQSPYMEFQIKGKTNLIVKVFSVWSIEDVGIYKNKIGVTVTGGEKAISTLVSKYLGTNLAEYGLSDILSIQDNSSLQNRSGIAVIEERILGQIASEAKNEFGINVSLFGFDRIELPEDTTESVFVRMKSERMTMVVKISEDGKKEAEKVKRDANLEKNKIIAEAEAQAVKIRGEADTKAFEYLDIYNKYPKFALFLRKLQALEDSMRTKTTIVIDKNTTPFDLLSGKPLETIGVEQEPQKK